MSVRIRRSRRDIVLAVVVATSLLAFRCGEKPRRPDILLITVDTTRADRIGAYGDHLALTPAIDRLASRGTTFENASCQAPITLPSHASMMTGTYPPYHGIRKNGGFALDPALDTLAEILQGLHYRTAAFVSAFPLNHIFGIAQGFETYDDVDATRATAPGVTNVGAMSSIEAERPGRETVDGALAWMATVRAEPIFLWVHLYEPHTPYAPPEPYGALFPHAMYRGEVAAMDREIDRLVAAFESREPGVIILVSDHGEGLGGHGEKTHGHLIYEETMRVPLIVVAPSQFGAGSIRSEFAETVDLLPTLLGIVGVSWDGYVQGRDLRGTPTDSLGYGETLYGKLAYQWSDLRAIRSGSWKYIHGSATELYDLRVDPGETSNRVLSDPDVALALRSALEKIIAEKPELPDSTARVVLSAAEREALSALGYVGVATAPVGRAALDAAIGVGSDPREGLRWVVAFERIDSLIYAGESDSAVSLAHEVVASASAGAVRLEVPATLLRSGEARAAAATCDALAREYPLDSRVAVTRAVASLLMRDLPAARASIDRARTLDATNPATAIVLARILEAEGKRDSAAHILDESLRLDSNQPAALLLLARIDIARQHIANAHTTIRELLRVAPDNAEAKRMLFDLEASYPELTAQGRPRDRGPDQSP